MEESPKKTKLVLKRKKEGQQKLEKKWKVLIVDDDPLVHKMTELVLADFTFKGGKLQFIDAFSGKEAEEVIPQHPDLALILLDVVMEEDDSGLKVVQFVREKLKNQKVRIILRTGQPGLAPEKAVIVDYDINDYKVKPELDADKLFSTIVSSLRAYDYICTIDTEKQTMEHAKNELEQEIKELNKAVHEIIFLSPDKQPEFTPYQNEQIREVTQYVISRIGENFQQADVAALLQMSPAAFSRFFKNTTGVTFVSFVNTLRIAKACKELVETNNPIHEIAARCGFHNLSNFNRRFQEIKEMSPRAFRKQFYGSPIEE